jgi:hypothetical protein
MVLENRVVDFPIDDDIITPKKASKHLAILLRLGMFAFAGVIIITMFPSEGGIKIPEIQCNDVVVGYTANMLSLLGSGGGSPIYEARYQIVVRNTAIPLPVSLTKLFLKGSRCGQP